MLILLAQVLQGLIIIILSPGLFGLTNWFKASRQGRYRSLSTVWQPYRNLGKLLRLPPIRSQQSGHVFATAPVLVFSLYAGTAFMIPSLLPATLFSDSASVFPTDWITLVYLFGMARFIMALAGLDNATAFGGLGSSRDMFFNFLTEVGLVLTFTALGMRWENTSLTTIVQSYFKDQNSVLLFSPDMFLLLPLSFAILVIYEAGRIPIENPDTHLELTMGIEAGLLEYAGRDLALIKAGEMIKLTVMVALLSHLFLPILNFGDWIKWTGLLAVIAALIAFSFKIIFLAYLLAWWEWRQPKRRLRKADLLALVSIVLSLVAILYNVV